MSPGIPPDAFRWIVAAYTIVTVIMIFVWVGAAYFTFKLLEAVIGL